MKKTIANEAANIADEIDIEEGSNAALESALTRLGNIISDHGVDASTAVGDTRDAILELFRHRPTDWHKMIESEQSDVARFAEQAAQEIVQKVVDAISSAGKTDPVKAILESTTEKDGIKLTLKVKTVDEDDALRSVVALHQMKGKLVLLTKASRDDYSGERGAVETDPDQRPLFEAGNDVPEGDGDLAGDE